MSQYITECSNRAIESMKALSSTGKTASHFEISSDVWGLIQLGGINMFPGQKIFCGLPVLDRPDLTNHIQAISNDD